MIDCVTLGEDTDFFVIVAGVLQGNTLAPYLFIICQDFVLRSSKNLMKENGLTQKRPEADKPRSQTTQMTPTQAKSLMHSRELTAGSISLFVNADKTVYVYFNQEGDIFTLKGSLKSVDKFTYLGSCVSSTENYINIRPQEAWTAIVRLSII